ncbi:MAG: DUF5711 family protein [Lachnospiraceae bacterium]
MANKGKTNLHVATKIPEKSAAELAEMRKRIRRHRLHVLRNMGLAILTLAFLISGTYYLLSHREYKEYKVLQESIRADSVGTQFLEFQGSILRYSHDGAFYTDPSNRMIWNQTYEFQHPIVDTCGNYMAIADQDSTQIYILDTTAMRGKISTTYPIKQISVAAQGTVAVLMEQNGVNYLQLYDKKGKNLAEGALHIENSGSALDLALSADAKKMGISMMDIKEGVVKTTILFYNFDSVGQSEIDNIVASYSYKNMVAPSLKYVTNNRMVAFGDNKVLVFEGEQKPELTTNMRVKEEVRSVFCNETYFGLVFGKADGMHAQRNQVRCYDYQGNEKLRQTFDLDYDQAEFLSNGEICIRNHTDCLIYTMSGVKKFTGHFRQGLDMILPVNQWFDYYLVLEGKTQKIRLK